MRTQKKTKWTSRAVRLQADRILALQAATVGLRAVVRAVQYGGLDGRMRGLSPQADAGLNALSETLYQELSEAWNQLAWFAGFHPEADALLKARTASWFEDQTCGIMDFLGMTGQYYVKDKDAFRAEVLGLLGVKASRNNKGATSCGKE